jgi:hypothetical protein
MTLKMRVILGRRLLDSLTASFLGPASMEFGHSVPTYETSDVRHVSSQFGMNRIQKINDVLNNLSEGQNIAA